MLGLGIGGVLVGDGRYVGREGAEGVEEESGVVVWGCEGGDVVCFLGPVVRVCLRGVGWGKPVCVVRNFRLRGVGWVSPEGSWEGDVDLTKFNS